MDVLIIVSLSIIVTCILFMLASFIETWSHRKIFQQVYDSLPNRIFYRYIDHVYSHPLSGVDDGFVWFTNDKDFRLTKKVDLYDMHSPYLNPYYHYWLRKYRKWFAENVDVDKLDRYTES